MTAYQLNCFTTILCYSFCTLGSRILQIPSDGECSKTYGTSMFFEYCEHTNATVREEFEELEKTLNNSMLADKYSESDFNCDTYFQENNASWHQVSFLKGVLKWRFLD